MSELDCIIHKAKMVGRFEGFAAGAIIGGVIQAIICWFMWAPK